MRSYIVDTAALCGNLENLKTRAGDAVFWAVLKGNGYGLGLLPMARACLSCGIDHFAVTEVSDAAALRELDAAAQILVLQPTSDPQELSAIISSDAIATVSSLQDAEALAEAAGKLGKKPSVHVKIDTGMGRYGFRPSELNDILTLYANESFLITGIYTHLHSAFCNEASSRAQAAAFRSVVDAIRQAGFDPGMAHLCNSCGLLRWPEYRMDGVRIGSAILGRLSIPGNFGLSRIGVCEAAVQELHFIPKGGTTGYGAGWKAKRDTQIAVFPVGYFHGFGDAMGDDLFRLRDNLRRILSALKAILRGKAFCVTVNGRRCKVVGHIGMLHTAVDMTGLDCKVGDIAKFDINPLLLKGTEVIFR